MFSTAAMLPVNLQAQNVGIGTATPLEKLHVIGNIRSSTLSGAGNRIVLADLNGTLLTATGATSPAWMTTGNSATDGGTISTTGVNFIGTTDAQNICFKTNNIERGRFSALGEFFVGTFNTVIVGDLMNAVGNPTFPWAVNGYVPAGSNGGGVYGQVLPSNSTVFGAVQGEYYGTNAAGAGVRGIAGNISSIGVQGQEPNLIGWAGIFNGDLGVASGGGYWTISDRKLKTNIEPVGNVMDKIKNIHAYTYVGNVERYPGFISTSRKTIGFMAQEIELSFPEAVIEKQIPTLNTTRNSNTAESSTMTIKAVSYDAMIPVLLEAIKEQQMMIEQLKIEITSLKK